VGLTKLQIMELFIVEATDHSNSLEQALIKLDEKKDLESIFSDMHIHAHTIKGAAAMVGFMNTSHVARFLEKVLLALTQKTLSFDSEIDGFIRESTVIIQKFIRNIAMGELNETIILRDIAKKYETIMSKVEAQNA